MKLILVLLIAACGSSQPAPAPPPLPPPPAVDAAPPPMGLSLTELKFYDGQTPKLALHADGKVEANTAAKPGAKPSWTAIAELSVDGKLAHDGQPLGELKPDGTFVAASGKTAPFKLEGDVLVIADKRVSLDDSGKLQGDAGAAKLRIEGATDATSRSTALFLLAIMVTPNLSHH